MSIQSSIQTSQVRLPPAKESRLVRTRRALRQAIKLLKQHNIPFQQLQHIASGQAVVCDTVVPARFSARMVTQTSKEPRRFTGGVWPHAIMLYKRTCEAQALVAQSCSAQVVEFKITENTPTLGGTHEGRALAHMTQMEYRLELVYADSHDPVLINDIAARYQTRVSCVSSPGRLRAVPRAGRLRFHVRKLGVLSSMTSPPNRTFKYRLACVGTDHSFTPSFSPAFYCIARIPRI